MSTPLIMIVDDQDTNRRVYSRLAGTVEGARIKDFGSVEDALLWLETNEPDLIITDFRMPALNGAEFTRRVRSMPLGADLPIVVVTVFQDRNLRLAALEAGATDFLLSPVDHIEFRTRVRNLLALRQQQRMLREHAKLLQQELAESENSRERLLRDSHEALAQVIDTVPAYISAADRNGRCVFANAHLAAALDTIPGLLVGRDMAEVLGSRGVRSQRMDRIVFERGAAVPAYEEERIAGGGRQILLTAKVPLKDTEGGVVAVLTSSLDITGRKLAEQRLHHLAHHDPLTDLPNRTLLAQRLEAAITRSSTRGGFALHLIDLDRFKAINDVYGHQVGDELLRAVSLRLGELFGPPDTVARLGGDEFAIIQTDVASAEAAASKADTVAQAVTQSFRVQGRDLSVGLSIGISLHPRDGATGKDILRSADLAMYQAKADGRGTYRFFDEEMDRRARDRMRNENALRAGISRGELVLYYQPQLCLRTRRVIGSEALVRWQASDGSVIPPSKFLPMAEESGLMAQITEWVLHEACRQGTAWRDAGLPMRIGVNIPPAQLEWADLVPLVKRTIASTGLPPAELDLELTEEALVRYRTGSVTAGTLLKLRDMGVTLSIDDFGTGYSALSYLKHLPVNRLKIDRSFVGGLSPSSPDAAIIRAIVQLGHSLGLKVSAEGVETAGQADEVRSAGCDEIQGYLVGKPMPAEAFTAFLRDARQDAISTCPL